jgi:hypothetical protein
MKFIHRIGLRATASQRKELESLGVKLPADMVLPGGNSLLAFDVDESHPNWPALSALFRKWHVSDLPRTEFAKTEIQAAKWLNLVSDWHHGYPQPNEDVFGYREATYDLSEYCPQCGVGLKQKAPFQMKAEPKWGRNGILQLNWIFDEYFVTPEVWTTVFEPRGIHCRQVLSIGGSELKTVVQLVVEQEIDIVTEGLRNERCARCGRVRYVPITKGDFPPIAGEPAAHMAKTKQFFGSGASATKAVLISHELSLVFAAENVRGASMRPVAEREGI